MEYVLLQFNGHSLFKTIDSQMNIVFESSFGTKEEAVLEFLERSEEELTEFFFYEEDAPKFNFQYESGLSLEEIAPNLIKQYREHPDQFLDDLENSWGDSCTYALVSKDETLFKILKRLKLVK